MNEETHQKLMTIKRSFRLLMNGPGSQSMRDKGLGYKLIGACHSMSSRRWRRNTAKTMT